MSSEQDDRDRLSEAGQSRRDNMLPLMQEAMRNANRQRRQRRSIAASLVLLIAAFIGWELIDLGTTTTRAPEMVVVDSAAPTGQTELAATAADSLPTDSTPQKEWDWAPFDPQVEYNKLVAKGTVVVDASSDSLPATWIIDQSVVGEVPLITTQELVAMLDDSGVSAGVFCDDSRCTLRILDSPQANEGSAPNTPLSQDPTQGNQQRKTAFMPSNLWPDLS